MDRAGGAQDWGEGVAPDSGTRWLVHVSVGCTAVAANPSPHPPTPPLPPPPSLQHFHVPDVIPDLSTEQVLASEWVPGVHIDKVGGAGVGGVRAVPGQGQGGGRLQGGFGCCCWRPITGSSTGLPPRPGTILAHPSPRPAPPLCPPTLPSKQVAAMPQEVRDEVGTKLLKLTLKELFHWRAMQTDPNWCATTRGEGVK